MGKWEMVRLGGYIEQIRGVSYKPEDAVETADATHKPILRAHNIQSSGLNNNNLIYVDKKRIKKIQYIQKGDIIICASSGSKNLVGKAAQAITNLNASFGAFCKAVRPKENIESRYLKHYFSSPSYRHMISELSAGANINNLRNEHLDNLQIPLPPLDIQQKIADVLDKASALIELRRAQLNKLDLLIKSQFIKMFGDPLMNPMRWKVQKLVDITTLIQSGNTPKGGKQVYVDSGIMFFRSQNVWRNRIELDNIAYIDEKTHMKMHQTSLKHKDILITKTGRFNTENSSLGRAALFLGENGSANINGHVYLVRLKDGVAHEFVLYILVTDEYKDYIRKVCVGGIDKRQINKEHLEEFPIIMPPLDLQNQFAAFVQQVDKSKFVLQQSLEKLEQNYKSLMQKCFRGEIF